MKTANRFIRYALFTCLVMGGTFTELRAQDDNVIKLTLHPRAVPENPDAQRLLPRELELRDGNAAIELLRMPWEQTHFMDLQRKEMNDWLDMKGDDPKLVKRESIFEHFKDKMRRAAYTRDADWDYPFGEQPMITILLPDVQGMRNFAGRVMSLWIRIQIAKGNLKAAEEGLLIQMACARHVSRTPFIVCHLVGNAIAEIGFEQFEDLIQHPNSENYYYALSMLPITLGDYKTTVEVDTSIVRSSMPSLGTGDLPPVEDHRWISAFNELHEYYITTITSAKEVDLDALKQQAQTAAKELPSMTGIAESDIEKMSDEEKATRWLLANFELLSGKYVAATQLPSHQTLQTLVELQQEIEKLNEKTAFQHVGEVPKGALIRHFFDIHSVQAFIGCHRFSRDVKLLQIVEAIRDHASKNDSRFPKSLSEIELHVPVDPFTNKPAEYELKDGVAVLRWPAIPGVKENYVRVKSYQLKMADAK